MKQMRIGSVVSTSAGVEKGALPVGYLPDGSKLEIPVIVARGRKDGPTLWLHGCVHGNEFCGAFVIHEVVRSLDPETLAGAVVALPYLNLAASQKSQRMSPFEGYTGGDLNRCFPGKPDGSHTEQMAHAIYRPLRDYADYFVDFHTAFTADTRWALFAPTAGETGAKAEGMARAFGFRHTLPTPLDILGGSALITAAKDGIPGLIVEAGGIGPAFSPETVADATERLRNVLRHLKMLPGAVTDHGALTYFSNFAWINATRGGLFRPAVRCGASVRKGDVVGRFYDVFGDLAEEATSPATGIVLAVAAGPMMPSGEILVHIGLDPREV